jgi:hypothetical protein
MKRKANTASGKRRFKKLRGIFNLTASANDVVTGSKNTKN